MLNPFKVILRSAFTCDSPLNIYVQQVYIEDDYDILHPCQSCGFSSSHVWM